MSKNLSFEPVDENNLTIAEQWLEKIDKPMMEHGWTAGIDRKALRQMKKAAKDAMGLPPGVRQPVKTQFAVR
jgi:hypothetical protein